MDQPIELLQSVARSCDSKALANYLNFCLESKLFCISNNKREANISLINSLLSSKENYIDGISILDIFVEQCPKDLLSANIVSWVQFTVKGLVNPDDSSFCPLSWKVLGKLIRISTEFPEARKNIALNTIPKVLDHFVREAKNSKEDFSTILHCLEVTLQAYGKSCGFHKEAITSILFSSLEASQCSVFIAGKCFLNLAACGSPGAAGDNYATSWLKQQQFLINSLHSHLDLLFENINEVQTVYKRFQLEEAYPAIPKVTEKGLIRKKQCLVKQFQSLAVFLKIMLLGKFPVNKKILPESILSLVWRGLVINNQTLKKFQQSIDTSSLATVISLVNLASLEILDALVTSCRINLLPFNSLICRIFSQTLKWTDTEDWPFGITKPNSSLRVRTYECLCNWFSITRACSGIDKYSDDVLNSILSDIHHEPPAVALKVPGGKGKKNKSNIADDTIPLTDFIVNPHMNADVCEAALKCASILLNTYSILLKPCDHRGLQEAIVREIILIQTCKIPPPYSDSKCRLALYDALLCLCQNAHPSFPPPINYASELFSNGIKDSSQEVSKQCLYAMRCIDKILRPLCPTLDFPVSQQSFPMINVTVNDTGDESYLLNDSSRKRSKRKRDHQVTSTPVNDNRSKRPFINEVDNSSINETSVHINEEICESNYGNVDGQSNTSKENAELNDSPKTFDEKEILNDNDISLAENKNNEINQHSKFPINSEEPNLLCIQNQIENKSTEEAEIHIGAENPCQNLEISSKILETNHQEIKSVVNSVTNDDVHLSKTHELLEERKLSDSAATCSEDEMLKSFVDETI